MKILYLECNMGAAGDMLLSALYELLDDKDAFLETMNHLGLPGVCLEAETCHSNGIAGTHIHVLVHGHEEKIDSSPEHHHDHDQDHDHHHEHDHAHDSDHHHHHHAHASPKQITDLIRGLSLPEEVKSHALAVYEAIAQAEAKAHGCPVGEVHYHEVGALDAVADVTGVCYALSLLNPDKILASPVHVGSGTVRCAHGIVSVPAPATALLLTGIPSYGGEISGELCTPTGAALLAHFVLSFGPMPLMATQKIGSGIGTREYPQANCVRAFFGENSTGANGEIIELVCNIDDMSAEGLSFACSRLLELGALDVYTLPAQMKKGRPGHELTVLCEPDQEEVMAHHVLEQTSTNGVRVRRCGKYFLTPGVGKVETQWGSVRLKTAEGFGIRHAKPEFDDAALLAKEANIPYQTVVRQVLKNL